MSHLSEYFKDMDDVRRYVESLKATHSAEDYELFCYLFGLLENEGISDSALIKGKAVKIDRFLVPMIQELNAKGIDTLACCSGLQEEHLNSKHKPKSGYLALNYNQTLFKKLQKEISDPSFIIKKSECYLQESIIITIQNQEDKGLKEKWNYLFKVLMP